MTQEFVDNKTLDIFLITLILIGIIMSILLFKVTSACTKNCNYLTGNIIKEKYAEIVDINLVYEIAQNVSQERQYIYDYYDCTNFSRTLRDRLINLSYNAKCIFGLKLDAPEEFSKHTWVELNISGYLVWIEATNGEFVKVNYYRRYNTYKGKFPNEQKDTYLLTRRGICG